MVIDSALMEEVPAISFLHSFGDQRVRSIRVERRAVSAASAIIGQLDADKGMEGVQRYVSLFVISKIGTPTI